MIAGEFDLSIGSILGFSGMAILIAVTPVDAGGFGWSMWPAVRLALVLALATGFVNGWLVMLTKLPSFIITLGTLFIFRGLTIAITRARTNRTQLGDLDEAPGSLLPHVVRQGVPSSAAASASRSCGGSRSPPGHVGPGPDPVGQLDLRVGRRARRGAPSASRSAA